MTRIARLGMVGSVALLIAAPAMAATRPDQPVQAWSAMQGTDTATLLQEVQDLPVSALALEDQPYCATDAEIAQTLDHDFGESRVDAEKGTELWGSAQMGTWTLVATRDDNTSCIIASGIGFAEGKSADVFYQTAGL